MRVRCKAAADFRANAVGHLELEDTPRGLSLCFLGVRLHREGYAPGPATSGVRVCVPWPSVYATRSGEGVLLLSVDSRFTPLCRFALRGFSRGEPPLRAELSRRRRVVRWGASAAMLVGSALLWLTLPELERGAGPVLALGVASLVALSIAAFGVNPDAWRVPAQRPQVVLDEFCAQLSRYLPQQVAAEIPVTVSRPLGIEELQAVLPRSAVGIAIILSAAGLAALILSNAIGRTSPLPGARGTPPDDAPPPSARAASLPSGVPPPAAAPNLSSPAQAPTSAEITKGAVCRCQRHASVLWRRPLPRLTPIVVARSDRTHGRHQHIELELVAINNGDFNLEHLNLSVVFHEYAAGSAPRTIKRPLYYAGPLRPGRSVRWRVEGRGTRFEVLGPDLPALAADGSDTAPPDRFAVLTAAEHRPLRLHGAMMLAFIGDARARQAAVELREARREREASYLDRVLAASGELQFCELEVIASGQQRYDIRGCVFNRSEREHRRVQLRARSISRDFELASPLAEPPALLGEQTLMLDEKLSPGAGHRVRWIAELANQSGLQAHAFEVSAEVGR